MSWLWLKTFGIDTPQKSSFSGLAFQWLQPWPLFWIILVFLAVIVGVVWIYERTQKPLSRLTKLMLGGLRVAAALLILMLIFEPIAHVKFSTDQRARLITLFDVSQSMGLKDPQVGYRMDVLNKTLADPELKFFSSLAERYEVNAWTFGSDMRHLELKKFLEKPPTFQVETAIGQRTRVGDALIKAYGELKGEQIAGVVLVSDGQSNDGEDPLSAAYILKQSKIPVFTVGVGDPNVPKDVRLLEPIAPEEVFLGDTILVQTDVVQTGCKGREAVVRVLRNKEEKGRAKVVLGDDHEKQRVTVHVPADEPGLHSYQIKVEPLGEELSVDNNVKAFRVKITEDKLKVLYVEGKPRRLFRFFKNALAREPTIQFTSLLQSAPPNLQESKGMEKIGSFPNPKTPEALLKYDMLILGDIELKRGFFTKEQMLSIKKFVEEGHGLMVIGGDEQEGCPASFRGTPLEDLLPVSLEGAQKEGVRYDGKKGFKLQLTSEGVDHVVMKVKDDEEATKKFWGEFEFTWFAKVGKAKEGTKVLAVHPDRQTDGGSPIPLIVLGRPGVGKVAYIGLNEFWKLRYGAEDLNFWTKFYRPLLHWLTPPKGAGKFIDLRTDRRTYQGGEKVRITAALHKPGMLKLTSTNVVATIEMEGGAKEQITLVEENEGIYTGSFVPQQGGKYMVWVSQAQGVGSPLEETKVAFFVEVPNLEFEHPEMNERALKEMAQLTGGQYFTVKDIGKLVNALATKPSQVLQTVQKELHDTILATVALILFFSLEWYLRRKRGLL